jgi:UDP-glucose 4-epimerase
MNILVTGGNGFIGRHVCDRLRALGHTPTVFDRHGSTVSPAAGFIGAPVFLGDTTDAAAVSEAVYHCDAVMHLAGVLGTQETITNPLPAVQTNIVGSLNVFQACALHNKRAVYIAVGNHWMNNPYSITKTTAERFALMFNKERGTKIAVVRGMNAYGPGQKAGPVRKIIPNFIIPALKGDPLTVYGDGSQVMDMIYVDDLADVLCAALLFNHGVYDSVFEAGTGTPTTVLRIAKEVIKQVGGGTIHHVPMRPGEPDASRVLANPETLAPFLYSDFASLENGGRGFMSLAGGIEATIPYYRNILAHA